MATQPIKQYVVDAFTDHLFSGNPAAVCILDEWLPDAPLQNIAIENNLSETAFLVKESDAYHLRWFTPGGEIDLCGHATLATAFVVLTFYSEEHDVTFATRSGMLTVQRNGDLFAMDFPAYKLTSVTITQELVNALGVTPQAVFRARDLVCILDSAIQVRNLQPDLAKIKELDGLLLHVTAQSDDAQYDIQSRSFAPKLSVAEDPVCGSGHCHIIPYWNERVQKKDWIAYQASPRGGVLYCAMEDERIRMAGHAILFSKGELYL